MPAGNLEAFFREVTKANSMRPQDPALWRGHGMELLGPPLSRYLSRLKKYSCCRIDDSYSSRLLKGARS